MKPVFPIWMSLEPFQMWTIQYYNMTWLPSECSVSKVFSFFDWRPWFPGFYGRNHAGQALWPPVETFPTEADVFCHNVTPTQVSDWGCLLAAVLTARYDRGSLQKTSV